MATSIISAGDAANLGVQTTGGDDGVLVLRSGTAGAKVDALSIAASGTGAFVGEVTATGFTGTLDGVLGGGTPAAATVTTIDASGDLTANNFADRNRIINGAMMVDQRNAGAAVTTANAYPVDRWYISNTANGSYSAEQVSDTPVGFSSSLKVTVTAAQTANTGNLAPCQIIEGYNIPDLGWGAAGAKTITLSFWVRSSLTGTFGGSLRNFGTNRSYPFTYTISVADTWEYKTITIAGDTSGTWLTTNGVGIRVRFSLHAPASSIQNAGAWYNGNATGATGQTQLASTNGATFYITGVQLEKSSTATEFEYRPYGTELALCQRYYGTGVADFRSGSSAAEAFVSSTMFPPMRSTPTAAFTAAADFSANVSGTPTQVALSTNTLRLNVSSAAGGGGDVYYVRSFSLSAEL